MAERQRPRPKPRGDDEGKGRGRCGTMEEHRRLIRLDPEYRWRRRHIEQEVRDWTAPLRR